jgi:flagellar basal body rod protein FlgG
MTPTGNPLDLALYGRGFFAIQGKSGTLYTRNGSFRVSGSGQLTTQDGQAVLNRLGNPIRLDPTKPIEIEKNGMVTQEGNPVGQIQVADFKQTDKLSKHGGSYFKFGGDAADRILAPATEVHQGLIESSNVSTSEVAVRIVGVMRQFEILQRAITLAGDMNKKTVEEVARVNG